MSVELIFASDHRGIDLRKKLVEKKINDAVNVKDIGIQDGSTFDYVDISKKLAEELRVNPNSLGIIICGSGQGVSIVLNRYSHIRAGLSRTIEDAVNIKEKLNANVLCLGSKQNTFQESLDILDKFTEVSFLNGKHSPCVNKLASQPTNHSDNGVNLIVRAIIKHNDHLLFTSVTKSNEDYANDLYFLPGGHVDHNEGSINALKREIKEEMGEQISDVEFAGVLECSWDKKGKIYHEINFVYNVQLPNLDLLNPPIAIDSPYHEFVWVPISKIKEIKILPETLKPLILKTLERPQKQEFYSQMLASNHRSCKK